ncbi:MAG TPA: hypothetical protein VG962_15790 [Steroidobacteraceae bacterium]|nr:hypothetical protein [Steroidobacteraceae bacterium]
MKSIIYKTLSVCSFAVIISMSASCANSTSDHTNVANQSNAMRNDNAESEKEAKAQQLIKAINENNVPLVRQLLESGVDPNVPWFNRYPLVSAIMHIENGRFVCAMDMVRLLLEFHADPNKPDLAANSFPLWDALGIGDMNCAALLREHKAQLEYQKNDRYQILVFATKGAVVTGNMKLFDLVLSWNIDPNTRDPKTGFYALSEAVWTNNVTVAKALVDRGVNPCLRDIEGRTPLYIAKLLKESQELINYLESVSHCD